jgi:hypothetical protein
VLGSKDKCLKMIRKVKTELKHTEVNYKQIRCLIKGKKELTSQSFVKNEPDKQYTTAKQTLSLMSMRKQSSRCSQNLAIEFSAFLLAYS